jgi:hypothetical protein
MQFASTAKPALAILYDSDFGRNIDSVLALALLHGFASKQQARVSALTINYPCLEAAELCDVIEGFYRKAVTGPGAVYMSAPAIGIVDARGKAAEPPVLVKSVLAKQGEGGKPLWQSNIRQWNDTAVPANLMRNDLAAQNDGNAVLVATGAATNLSRLLALHDTAPLITAKVKMLVIAENGFAADAAAAKHVLAEWPSAIVLCDSKSVDGLLFPGQCIDKDFSYVPVHPIAEAYRAYRPMPYDAPAVALAAMLYAVRPADGYFAAKPGTIVPGTDGHVTFSESAAGKHSYLTAVPAKHDETIQKFTSMVSAEPVVIRPFRRQQQAPKEAPATKS